MVDSTKKDFAYDGMYVVLHDDLLRVKRLRRTGDDTTVILKSDNKASYPPDGEELVRVVDIDVVGRVVWSGRKEF